MHFFLGALKVKINFSENYFRDTISLSNSLDPDQERRSVGPDLAKVICRMTKVAAGKQRVKKDDSLW